MLDSQANALLEKIRASGLPPYHTLAPEQARELYKSRRPISRIDTSIQAVDMSIPCEWGAISIRHYRPATCTGPAACLLYFHGGGWVFGDLETHDAFCRDLASKANCAVISVAYRLAPESRFPAAVDDCIAATHWTIENANALAIDPRRVAVGGDSAGGTLAAVVAIAWRDAGRAPLRFQLLLFPATDMRALTTSYVTNGQGYVLTADTMRYFRGHYIANPGDYVDWRASPLLAADHRSLPPALVITAGFDPLRDDGLLYANALSAADVPTQHVCFERQVHSFILLSEVLDDARTAIAICASSLQMAFADGID